MREITTERKAPKAATPERMYPRFYPSYTHANGPLLRCLELIRYLVEQGDPDEAERQLLPAMREAIAKLKARIARRKATGVSLDPEPDAAHEPAGDDPTKRE